MSGKPPGKAPAKPPGKAPGEAALYQAALNHLARYGATQASLARVLGRRVDRWARAAAADAPAETVEPAARAAKAAVPAVIARLTAEGLLNDGEFAASRARRLSRAGKSRLGGIAHLTARGIAPAAAAATLPDDPARELAAACVLLRRRRAGAFGAAPALKTLAALARNGFSQAVARQAMALDREAAEALIRTLQAL
jgi:regulatory protein